MEILKGRSKFLYCVYLFFNFDVIFVAGITNECYTSTLDYIFVSDDWQVLNSRVVPTTSVITGGALHRSAAEYEASIWNCDFVGINCGKDDPVDHLLQKQLRIDLGDVSECFDASMNARENTIHAKDSDSSSEVVGAADFEEADNQNAATVKRRPGVLTAELSRRLIHQNSFFRIDTQCADRNERGELPLEQNGGAFDNSNLWKRVDAICNSIKVNGAQPTKDWPSDHFAIVAALKLL